MESHELLKDILKKISAKQIAGDMGLSLSLIYKWAEPPAADVGSGARNPLDRLQQLYEITGDVRIPKWVCQQSGGYFIRNPVLPKGEIRLIPVTNEIVQEFADMLGVIAMAASDQKITADEAKNIRARWDDLKSVTEGFVQAAEAGNFNQLQGKLEEA